VVEKFEKSIKGVAKYIADRVKEQHSFYLGLSISLTASVMVSKVMDIILKEFGIADLTTLLFALTLFIVIAVIGGYATNVTLILDVKGHTSVEVDWKDVVESILNLKGDRLGGEARIQFLPERTVPNCILTCWRRVY
jgi:hypothetical protein